MEVSWNGLKQNVKIKQNILTSLTFTLCRNVNNYDKRKQKH